MQKSSNKRSVITLLLLFGGLFMLFFGLVVSAASLVQGGARQAGPSVGVVEIKGIIEDAKDTMAQIRGFVEDEEIEGIVVRVDSPGGAVGPSQEIYREVLKATSRKKVVASLGAVAASGGYYAICGADKIIANPGTITGSIGVVMQVIHVEEILDMALLRTETFKSGALKDAGSQVRPVSAADRSMFEGMIASVHDQFQRAVQKERDLDADALAGFSDGRVLTGEQAREIGLVDELGNLHDAVGHLQALAGFKGIPRLVYPSKKPEQLLRELIDEGMGSLASSLVRVLGPRVEYRLPSGI